MKIESARSLYSHLAAVAVGAALAYAVRQQPIGESNAPATAKVEKRQREKKLQSGEGLIDQLQLAITSRQAREKVVGSGELRKLFADLSKTLNPSADPKSAFLDLLAVQVKSGNLPEPDHLSEDQAKSFVTLGVRYAHWFHQDPATALAWKSSGAEIIWLIKERFLHDIARPLYQNQGLRASMVWLELIPKNAATLAIIGEDLGKRSSVEDLSWFLQNHPGFASGPSFDKFAVQMGGSWAIADRDLAPPLLKGTACAGFMLGLAARMEGTSGVAWIRSWIESGKLDPEAVRGVSNDSVISRMAYDNKRPVNDRIAILRQLSARQETSDSQLQEQMASGHVSQFLNGEDDWLYAFRHGQVTADEVMAAAIASAPKLGDAEDDFRNHLFRHLAEDNDIAAMSVLEGRSEEDKISQKILAARWWFVGVEPDRFYEVMSSIPHEGDAEAQKVLRRSWLDKSVKNLERFGEDYLTWVKALPAGENRKWALEAVLEASKLPYPWISAEAKAQLGGTP